MPNESNAAGTSSPPEESANQNSPMSETANHGAPSSTPSATGGGSSPFSFVLPQVGWAGIFSNFGGKIGQRPDAQHYLRTFPPRLVYCLSASEAVLAICAISSQIVLMSGADPGRATISAIDAASGIWAGLAAAMAACLAFLAARRPTRCTIPACLFSSCLTGLLSLAMVFVATYGLVLLNKADAEDEDEDPGRPKLVRIHFFHPLLNGMMIHPEEDEDEEQERAERRRQLAKSQLICFNAQVLAGVGQVLISGLLSAMTCRSWRCQSEAGGGRIQSVLFSTRSEGEQRDGFISIQVPAGLCAVTGNTLERGTAGNGNGTTGSEESTSGGGERAADGAGAAAVAAENDPPPKYEDMSFHM